MNRFEQILKYVSNWFCSIDVGCFSNCFYKYLSRLHGRDYKHIYGHKRNYVAAQEHIGTWEMLALRIL